MVTLTSIAFATNAIAIEDSVEGFDSVSVESTIYHPLLHLSIKTITDDKQKQKYFLVLDLDETLVHYQEDGDQGKFLIRPFAYEFLEEMAQYYEVMIFTAATQEYADWILNLIDRKKSIKHRFYRRHTVPDGMNFVKDLSRIGRNLAKMIIVDNVAENF